MAWPTACKQVSRFGVAVRASPLVRLALVLHSYNQSSIRMGLHRNQVLRSLWRVFDGGFNLKTEWRHSTSPSFSLSLCILLCECLRSTCICSRLEINKLHEDDFAIFIYDGKASFVFSTSTSPALLSLRQGGSTLHSVLPAPAFPSWCLSPLVVAIGYR